MAINIAIRPFLLIPSTMTVIYHNPRCSKSRATLELLNQNGVKPEIVPYLDNPPDATTLTAITKMLSCSIFDIIRKGEAIYTELDLSNQQISEQEMIDIVVDNPKLLERPIVVNGDRAAVGRPPENVLGIL